jgi:hypothetical protein
MQDFAFNVGEAGVLRNQLSDIFRRLFMHTSISEQSMQQRQAIVQPNDSSKRTVYLNQHGLGRSFGELGHSMLY